jgi:quinol monooxygenase YgiN
MIAQLTHLRPRPGHTDAVLALLREWGEATRDAPARPSYSFLCQDDDHLFVVSLHADQASYEAGARANAAWLARLMPLLVDGHGPTYYGPVLGQEGQAAGDGVPFPAALKIGHSH